MKIEYDEIKSVYAENIEYEEDGKVLTADIIKTEYVPKSFEGTTKIFCLRENHSDWDRLLMLFKEKCEQEWLKDLGYDNSYYVHHDTKKITKINEDVVNQYYIENIPNTESETI